MKKVCVIGLGYVGLPTAILLSSKNIIVNGYDVNKKKIKPRNINEIKPGGLGTHFIDQIMDNVRWVKSDIWNNKLILKKKIK